MDFDRRRQRRSAARRGGVGKAHEVDPRWLDAQYGRGRACFALPERDERGAWEGPRVRMRSGTVGDEYDDGSKAGACGGGDQSAAPEHLVVLMRREYDRCPAVEDVHEFALGQRADRRQNVAGPGQSGSSREVGHAVRRRRPRLLPGPSRPPVGEDRSRGRASGVRSGRRSESSSDRGCVAPTE